MLRLDKIFLPALCVHVQKNAPPHCIYYRPSSILVQKQDPALKLHYHTPHIVQSPKSSKNAGRMDGYIHCIPCLGKADMKVELLHVSVNHLQLKFTSRFVQTWNHASFYLIRHLLDIHFLLHPIQSCGKGWSITLLSSDKKQGTPWTYCLSIPGARQMR